MRRLAWGLLGLQLALLLTAATYLTNSGTYSGTEYRTCGMIFGTDNGSALAAADLGPQGQQCKIPVAGTIAEIDVNSDAGTPNIIVRKKHCGTFTAGVCTSWTSTNVLSSALAAAASNFDACSKTGATTSLDAGTTCAATLQNTALAAGDWLEVVSGTAGGTSNRVSVSVIWSVP